MPARRPVDGATAPHALEESRRARRRAASQTSLGLARIGDLAPEVAGEGPQERVAEVVAAVDVRHPDQVMRGRRGRSDRRSVTVDPIPAVVLVGSWAARGPMTYPFDFGGYARTLSGLLQAHHGGPSSGSRSATPCGIRATW